MKRRLPFINDEKGFFLPYVLFIVSIIFIILTTNLNTYKKELHITDNHLEQLKLETLLQMARTKFKDEIPQLQANESTVNYTFRDGIVEIAYTKINDAEYRLTISIFTAKKSYVITNYLLLDNNKNKT